MTHIYERFTDVVMASMRLAIDRLYADRHPGDPSGDASIELAEENLFEKCRILVEDMPEQNKVKLIRVDGKIVGMATDETEHENLVDSAGNVVAQIKIPEMETLFDKFVAQRGGRPIGGPEPELPSFKQDLEMTDEEVADLVHGKPFPMPNTIGGVEVPVNTPTQDVINANRAVGLPDDWQPLSERTSQAIEDSKRMDGS